MELELIGYDGPDVGDKPKPPELAKTDGLSDEERTEAIRQFYDESLMVKLAAQPREGAFIRIPFNTVPFASGNL